MIAVAIGVNAADAPSAHAYGTNWWHSLSQQQRNQRIVDYANRDVGKWGGQCKAWVQGRVVFDASGGHVWLPLNQPPPNDWMWYNDANGHAVGMSMPIENVQVGMIIQMKLKSGSPHTAIIAGKSSTGVTFIDSNWSTNNDEIVRVHSMTFSQFYGMLQSPGSYSVYYIL